MPMYIAEFSWRWDEKHTDYATLSVEEDIDSQVEDLRDPNYPEEERAIIFQRFKEIAGIQDGCWRYPSPYSKALTIYRVVIVKKSSEEVESKVVTFEMVPIFRFDENGKPIPIT